MRTSPPELPLLERQKGFAGRLQLMKLEAAQLRLYETMQALEIPVKAVGWEIARQIEKASPLADNDLTKWPEVE